MPQDPGNPGPQDFDMQWDPENPGPQNFDSRKTLETQDLRIWICGETLETQDPESQNFDVSNLTLAPAGVWANLEPAGGGWFQPPPWDLENYATHREAVNGVR